MLYTFGAANLNIFVLSFSIHPDIPPVGHVTTMTTTTGVTTVVTVTIETGT